MVTYMIASIVGILTIPLYAVLISSVFAGLWIFTVSNEKKFWAFLNMALLAIVLAVAFQFNPLTFAVANPFMLVGAIVGYVVIGAAWGYFGKWRLFLFKVKIALSNASEDWMAHGKDSKFEDFCRNHLRDEGIIRYGQSWPIKVNEHIGKITMWMAYWPASMAWTIMGDLIQTLYTRFVIYLSTSMQKMASKQDDEILAEAKLKNPN